MRRAATGARLAGLAGTSSPASPSRPGPIPFAHNNGDPLNRIAAAVGAHLSAVRRVLDAAEEHQRRYVLAAV